MDESAREARRRVALHRAAHRPRAAHPERAGHPRARLIARRGQLSRLARRAVADALLGNARRARARRERLCGSEPLLRRPHGRANETHGATAPRDPQRHRARRLHARARATAAGGRLSRADGRRQGTRHRHRGLHPAEKAWTFSRRETPHRRRDDRGRRRLRRVAQNETQRRWVRHRCGVSPKRQPRGKGRVSPPLHAAQCPGELRRSLRPLHHRSVGRGRASRAAALCGVHGIGRGDGCGNAVRTGQCRGPGRWLGEAAR